MLTSASLVGALVSGLPACGGASMPRAQAPAAPSEQFKCKVAAGRENPLVTEWPASEKANLEARLRQGAVVVEYSGCNMRLLPACQLGGQYSWQHTTVTSDVIEIQNADDLYAKLPLGALSLEGELERTGRLTVKTTVSGQLQLDGFSSADVPESGACAGATHVLHALTVGSFTLRSGGTLRAAASADVGAVGTATGRTSSEESLLRDAGEPAACRNATAEAPDPNCRSPIQAFLTPLPRMAKEKALEGMVKATFVSASASQVWDVRSNDKTLCQTPCTRWINPLEAYQLRSGKVGFMQPGSVLDLPDLRPYSSASELEIRAEPRSQGLLVNGIVVTALGGAGVFIGGFLALLGCAGDRAGLCTAGAVTAGAGAVAIAPGLWMILASGPQAEVTSDRAPFVASRRAALIGSF